MSNIIHLHQYSERANRRMLRLVFKQEITPSTDYPNSHTSRVESDFVASLEKLNSELQYCITNFANESHLDVDPLWKDYLAVWCDSLSRDIAKSLASAKGGHEWPGCIDDIEAQVDRKVDGFLKAMFRDQVFYHSIKYRLSA